MAQTLDLGTLRVALDIDNKALSASTAQAQAQFQSFARKMTEIAAGVQLERRLTQAVDAFVNNIKRAFTVADDLSKQSQKIGIPIEQLSALKHAAELADVSMGTLQTGMRALSREMTEALRDPASEAGRTFAAIGVSANTLRAGVMPTFSAIADAMSRYKDDAAKMALAQQLLGRSGLELIPLLNEGAGGIKRLMEEARELGIVIDTQTGKQAEAFNDNLKRLQTASDGLFLKISAQLMPTMGSLSQAMVQVAKDGRLVSDMANVVSFVMRSVTQFVAEAVAEFRKLSLAFSAIGQIVSQVTKLQFAEAVQTYKDWSTQAQAISDGLKTTIATIWDEPAAMVAAKAPEIANKISAPIIQSAAQIKEAARQLKDQMRAALDELLSRDTTPATEKFMALDAALKSQVITWQQYGNMVRKVKEQQVSNLLDLGRETASTLTAIFKNSKAAAIAAAIINTAVGVTQALRSYPPPISFAMAALQAAAGAAQIAAISSTNESGGGGGGKGAAPVPSAQAASAAASTALPQQTLIVEGLRPDSLYGGEAVRKMAENLLQYQRDGGKVVLA